jgi:hypothetical protein
MRTFKNDPPPFWPVTPHCLSLDFGEKLQGGSEMVNLSTIFRSEEMTSICSWISDACDIRDSEILCIANAAYSGRLHATEGPRIDRASLQGTCRLCPEGRATASIRPNRSSDPN